MHPEKGIATQILPDAIRPTIRRAKIGRAAPSTDHYYIDRPPEAATRLTRGDLEHHRRLPIVAKQDAALGPTLRSARALAAVKKKLPSVNTGLPCVGDIKVGSFSARHQIWSGPASASRCVAPIRQPHADSRSALSPKQRRTPENRAHSRLLLEIPSLVNASRCTLSATGEENGGQTFSIPAGSSQHRRHSSYPKPRAQNQGVLGFLGLHWIFPAVPSSSLPYPAFPPAMVMKPGGGIFSAPAKHFGS